MHLTKFKVGFLTCFDGVFLHVQFKISMKSKVPDLIYERNG